MGSLKALKNKGITLWRFPFKKLSVVFAKEWKTLFSNKNNLTSAFQVYSVYHSIKRTKTWMFWNNIWGKSLKKVTFTFIIERLWKITESNTENITKYSSQMSTAKFLTKHTNFLMILLLLPHIPNSKQMMIFWVKMIEMKISIIKKGKKCNE